MVIGSHNSQTIVVEENVNFWCNYFICVANFLENWQNLFNGNLTIESTAPEQKAVVRDSPSFSGGIHACNHKKKYLVLVESEISATYGPIHVLFTHDYKANIQLLFLLSYISTQGGTLLVSNNDTV